MRDVGAEGLVGREDQLRDDLARSGGEGDALREGEGVSGEGGGEALSADSGRKESKPGDAPTVHDQLPRRLPPSACQSYTRRRWSWVGSRAAQVRTTSPVSDQIDEGMGNLGG